MSYSKKSYNCEKQNGNNYNGNKDNLNRNNKCQRYGCSCVPRCDTSSTEVVEKYNAFIESQNVISTFVTRFSTAINATSPAAREIAIQSILETLTPNFVLEFTGFGPTITITNYQELLSFIELLASFTTFTTSLVGNFSLIDYDKNCCTCARELTIGAIELITQLRTNNIQLISIKEVFTVHEVSCNVFKISKLVGTATSLPLIPTILLEPTAE